MDENFEIDALEEYPTLVLVARFAKLIPRTDWFRYVGEPLEKEVVEKSRAYLDALGFPEATPAEVEDWQEAAASLEKPVLGSGATVALCLVRGNYRNPGSAVTGDGARPCDQRRVGICRRRRYGRGGTLGHGR